MFPVRSAGAIAQIESCRGKFQGFITPTTPMGSLIVRANLFGYMLLSMGRVSPAM